MKLYGSLTSPYVRHIRTFAALLQIDCELVRADNQLSAKLSPTKRVPFLQDDELLLTDSSSILLYLKQRAGLAGFDDVRDFDLLCTVNTAMDAEINLFFMARDGVTDESSAYLQRQRSRVLSTLSYLNNIIKHDDSSALLTDAQMRLACFLSWADFRNRFSVAEYPNLQRLLDFANTIPEFAATAPPQ